MRKKVKFGKTTYVLKKNSSAGNIEVMKKISKTFILVFEVINNHATSQYVLGTCMITYLKD